MQVLEVWSTWHALGMQHQSFPLIKSFLQDLSRALHQTSGYDGESRVRLLTVRTRQLGVFLMVALVHLWWLCPSGVTRRALLAKPSITIHVSLCSPVSEERQGSGANCRTSTITTCRS